MRIYIRGPGLGPVRTTLWSSGRSGCGGKVTAALFLPLAVILLALNVRFWPFDVFVAAVAALMLFGRHAQRKEAAQAAAAKASAAAGPETPESPAAYSDRR